MQPLHSLMLLLQALGPVFAADCPHPQLCTCLCASVLGTPSLCCVWFLRAATDLQVPSCPPFTFQPVGVSQEAGGVEKGSGHSEGSPPAGSSREPGQGCWKADLWERMRGTWGSYCCLGRACQGLLLPRAPLLLLPTGCRAVCLPFASSFCASFFLFSSSFFFPFPLTFDFPPSYSFSCFSFPPLSFSVSAVSLFSPAAHCHSLTGPGCCGSQVGFLFSPKERCAHNGFEPEERQQ